MDCPKSHTLIETLFNPLHYKVNDCPEKTSANKFSCTKMGELCCHSHSKEDREQTIEAMKEVPKVLHSLNDYMQYYLEEY